MKQSKAENSEEPTDEERETIESLLNYPSLENAFAESGGGGKQLKQKMLLTVAELERVIRRGSRMEAEKASVITAAYRTTLDFLDELEARRNSRVK